MAAVPRHTITDHAAVADECKRLDTDIAGLLDRLREEEKPIYQGAGSVVGQLWRTCTTVVADLSVLDPTARRMRELLAIARDAGVAIFWASEGPVTWPPVNMNIGPLSYRIPATGKSAETTPHVWETVLWQQEICRLQHAQKMLIADEEFTLAPGTDRYVLAWVEAMRAVWARKSHALQAILDASELCRPENAPNSDPEYLDRIVYPKMQALYFAVQGPAVADDLNAVLESGLNSHRNYYSSDERADLPEGFISWPLLGAACMAMRYGTEIRVSSEYLPEYLLRPADWVTTLGW